MRFVTLEALCIGQSRGCGKSEHEAIHSFEYQRM